jgi:hypothetical protein
MTIVIISFGWFRRILNLSIISTASNRYLLLEDVKDMTAPIARQKKVVKIIVLFFNGKAFCTDSIFMTSRGSNTTETEKARQKKTTHTKKPGL